MTDEQLATLRLQKEKHLQELSRAQASHLQRDLLNKSERIFELERQLSSPRDEAGDYTRELETQLLALKTVCHQLKTDNEELRVSLRRLERNLDESEAALAQLKKTLETQLVFQQRLEKQLHKSRAEAKEFKQKYGLVLSQHVLFKERQAEAPDSDSAVSMLEAELAFLRNNLEYYQTISRKHYEELLHVRETNQALEVENKRLKTQRPVRSRRGPKPTSKKWRSNSPDTAKARRH